MGRWAQRQKRGSQALTTQEQNAPGLAFTPPDVVDWFWPNPDPDHWQLQVKDPPSDPWADFDTAPGTARSYSPIPVPAWVRIQGRDAADVPTTNWSNEVLTA